MCLELRPPGTLKALCPNWILVLSRRFYQEPTSNLDDLGPECGSGFRAASTVNGQLWLFFLHTLRMLLKEVVMLCYEIALEGLKASDLSKAGCQVWCCISSFPDWDYLDTANW